MQDLTYYCSREVKCVDISGQSPLDAQRPLLMEKPDVVAGTPSRVLAHIKAGNLNLKDTLEMLVIDEADLVFSFGYEDDIKSLLGYFPKIYQAFLMSATLSEHVQSLKKLVLHNPVILKLEESQLPETSQLTQYHIKCEEEDKFVLIYALFKLRLIRGKTIIFVNTIDRCYRLKLYLEHFAIPACIINSELPINSRCHIVNQFNEGIYDVIISADEKVMEDPTKTKKKNKKVKKDKESGVSRGIDFHNVSNVVNFDFPQDVDSYVHRVGRTARGDNQGTALSFVSIKEMDMLSEVEESLSGNDDESKVFQPYNFRMEELDGFRYRAKDAMRMVTSIAVREARMKEIKSEVVNSEKLKSYFADNPRDLQVLRHDKNLRKTSSHTHLKNVPEYIVPQTLRKLQKGGIRKNRQRQQGTRQTHTQMKYKRKQADPLKSFAFSGLSSKKKKKK